MRSKVRPNWRASESGVQQENPSRVPVGSGINDADNGPNEVNYLGSGVGGLGIALFDLSRCSSTRLVDRLIEPFPSIGRQSSDVERAPLDQLEHLFKGRLSRHSNLHSRPLASELVERAKRRFGSSSIDGPRREVEQTVDTAVARLRTLVCTAGRIRARLRAIATPTNMAADPPPRWPSRDT